jgi:hypothetical protein
MSARKYSNENNFWPCFFERSLESSFDDGYCEQLEKVEV